MGFSAGDAVVAAGVVAELLEFAASDDVSGFRLAADRCPSAVCAAGLWYGRCMRSGRMLLLHRTALMVAASFGSLDVLHHVLTLSTAADVNLHCDPDGATPPLCCFQWFSKRGHRRHPSCSTPVPIPTPLMLQASAL
ncbi:hypothetical protein HPP92_013747 [Vanilla planifolia]|uniref:Uncharacterized protein n=1 Tax=Vanilla planifolia TaxID=51239 RepID=A0A835PJF3_VANPL|nr:hypothetical protein HPP92_026468 [Vanilla planifolia]KAG0479028.1 hypothetical protein HPP92_013747 [Vanilla planifolia]